MARGKKTGGRNFTKGDPRAGRPKGSRDKIPRSFKTSVRALFEEVANQKPDLLKSTIERGLKAAAPKSFQYLQLAAYYIDGKPAETIKVQPDLSKLTDEELESLEKLLARAHA